MNERYRIILYIIGKVLYWSLVVFLILFTAYVIFMSSLSDIETIFIGFFMMIVTGVVYLFDYVDKNKRFKVKPIGSHIFEYNYDNKDTLLRIVEENCFKKGYIFKSELHTNLDETFVLHATDNSDFPKEKIGVYISRIYECEAQTDNDPIDFPPIVPGQGRFNFEYRPFLNKICGKNGRDYNAPKEWVNIESTIIVVVDSWNGILNWVVNGSGHLPFVLIGLIVTSNPGKLYIVKDNRKKSRDDYKKKCNELLDVLEVRNRIPIGTLKYTDIKEKFKVLSFNKMRKTIEQRNKEGRYYI